MSVIEVHPEELMDREQRGTLSAGERELLDAHLVRCAACRLERQLRVDFERELGDRARVDITGVVSTAMQACELPEAESRAQAAQLVPTKRSTGRRLIALLAACALLGMGIGLAGAQLGIAERPFWGLLDAREVNPKVRPRRARSGVSAPATPTPMATPAPTRSQQPEPAGSAAVQRSTPPGPARSERVAAHSRRSLRLVPQTRNAAVATAIATSSTSTRRSVAASSVPVAPSVTLPPAPRAEAAPSEPAAEAPMPAQPSEAESSGQLFELANRARRMGRGGEANTLYRELQARFPDSPEARLSVAVVARMQLDLGQPREALAGFDVYLRGPDRALHEEAMVGRIKALLRLDRMVDARDAARDLLALHPRSAFVENAKKLLETTEP